MVYELINERKTEKQIQSYSNNGIENITEVSDTAQTVRELNDDTTEDKFSNIDMKTRLVGTEIGAIIVIDTLVAMDFLPKESSFITRSKKRLAVSEKGKGREEIVAISQGMKEQSQGTNMIQKFGNMFKGGQ